MCSKVAAGIAAAVFCLLSLIAIGGAAGVVSNTKLSCTSVSCGDLTLSLTLIGYRCQGAGAIGASCTSSSVTSYTSDCKQSSDSMCATAKTMSNAGAGAIACYALGLVAAVLAASFRFAAACASMAKAPAKSTCATSPAASLVPSSLALVLFYRRRGLIVFGHRDLHRRHVEAYQGIRGSHHH